jgi:hypothetical protein
MSRDQEYDNTNTGALFLNKRKTSPKAPEWRGQITIKTPDGEVIEYWVSCWEKVSRAGDDFLSLALDLKEDQEDQRGRDRGDTRRRDDRDDDRAPRRSAVGRNRREDNDRGDTRDRDDRAPSRSREDDRPVDDRRRASSTRDLDDEIPF